MATLQDLGLVTSYGYAVAGGYVGTVAQYEYYLAHLPQYAQTAEQSATSAAASATEATAAATTATTEAGKAATSENNAGTYASNASTSMAQAAQYASNASASALAANNDADVAHDSAQTAIQKASEASASATNAASSETNAADSEAKAKSWAVGPNASSTSGTDTNNAKYWCEQAQAIVGLDVFEGATATTNGKQGLVPGPGAGQQNSVLFGDATFKKLNYVFEGDTTAWSALSASDKAFYKVVILTDD